MYTDFFTIIKKGQHSQSAQSPNRNDLLIINSKVWPNILNHKMKQFPMAMWCHVYFVGVSYFSLFITSNTKSIIT